MVWIDRGREDIFPGYVMSLLIESSTTIIATTTTTTSDCHPGSDKRTCDSFAEMSDSGG